MTNSVACRGSAGCIEGVTIRTADRDTLYVVAKSTVYKVDLALIKAPSRNEERFMDFKAEDFAVLQDFNDFFLLIVDICDFLCSIMIITVLWIS
jgi:hypothetical protein